MKKHQMTPFKVHGTTSHRIAHSGKGAKEATHHGMARGGRGGSSKMPDGHMPQDDDQSNATDVHGGSPLDNLTNDYGKDDDTPTPSQPQLSQTPSSWSPPAPGGAPDSEPDMDDDNDADAPQMADGADD